MTEKTNKNELHLFFDTETSGSLNKKLSFDDPNQTWVVQIGAILSTKEEILKELNIIIKANGRSINPFAEKVHGISVSKADELGVSEQEAIELFADLMIDHPKKVCHNYDFDWPLVYQLFQRQQDKLSDAHRSVFYLDLPHVCTMKSKSVISFVGAKNKLGRTKWPKLIELHEKLFNEGFDDAHDAFADIKATRRCYYELRERGII